MSDSIDELVKAHPRIFLLLDIMLYTLFATVMTIMVCVAVATVMFTVSLF